MKHDKLLLMFSPVLYPLAMIWLLLLYFALGVFHFINYINGGKR